MASEKPRPISHNYRDGPGCEAASCDTCDPIKKARLAIIPWEAGDDGRAGPFIRRNCAYSASAASPLRGLRAVEAAALRGPGLRPRPIFLAIARRLSE